jgi:polysaccharide lyase-like protein
MAGTPSNPVGIYELDWDDLTNQTIPPKVPDKAPPDWAKEYVYPITGNTEPQIRLAILPAEPVRGGWSSARFELNNGDPPPPSGGKRAELSATPFEPVNLTTGTERWYGFSIYLPSTWVSDTSKEIVTQWHQDWNEPSGGSPPLSINTNNGEWEISLKIWTGANNTDNRKKGLYKDDLGKWTDWVVHAIWSADPTIGYLQIWKNNNPVPVLEEKRQTSYTRNDLSGITEWGNYMKIGIYKWAWSSSIGATTKRVMFHDEVRVADGTSGSKDAVAPRQEFTLVPKTMITYAGSYFGQARDVETGEVLIKGLYFATYTRTKRYTVPFPFFVVQVISRWPVIYGVVKVISSFVFAPAELTIDIANGMMVLEGKYGFGWASNNYSGTVTPASTYLPEKTFTGSGNVLRV